MSITPNYDYKRLEFRNPQKVSKIPTLTLEDNRMGFDMNKVKGKIFGLNQKFHSHEDSKEIGLYLIYNQIKKLHGNIEAESEVNKGTKFTITFQPL